MTDAEHRRDAIGGSYESTSSVLTQMTRRRSRTLFKICKIHWFPGGVLGLAPGHWQKDNKSVRVRREKDCTHKTKTVKRWGSWLSPSPSVEAGTASDFLSEGVCSRDIALLSDDVRHGGRKNSVELCEDVVRSNIHQCSRPGLRCELFEVSHPAEYFP